MICEAGCAGAWHRLLIGSIHAKTTNRDRRQVTDFVKNWTLGEKGWVIFDSDVTIDSKPFIFIANSSFFAAESLPQAKGLVRPCISLAKGVSR